MKTTPFDKYWEDKGNWKWGMVYYCKDDPRIVVPKKPSWMGRTLNFAHTRAYWCLFWTMVLAATPALLVGLMPQSLWIIMYSCIIVGLVVFFYVTDLRAEG